MIPEKKAFSAPKPMPKPSRLADSERTLQWELINYSVKKAAARIHQQKNEELTRNRNGDISETMGKLKNFQLTSSEYADKSAIGRGFLSPDDSFYASVGWSGVCKIWTADDEFKPVTELEGHAFKCYDLDFHPKFGKIDKMAPNIITSGADCTIRLWTFDKEKEKQANLQLIGHQDRVNKAKFHPSGLFAVSASYDKSACFWDLEHQKIITRLKGHTAGIHTLSLHPDGALIYTGDLEAVGIIWDIRTGKPILPLHGHSARILSSDFSPNGYQIATGSFDNTLKIWDLRRKGILSDVPCHQKLISDVRYQKDKGHFLMTSSYDGTAKLIPTDTYLERYSLKLTNSRISSISMNASLTRAYLTTIEKQIYLFSKRIVSGPQATLDMGEEDFLFGDGDFLSKILNSS